MCCLLTLSYEIVVFTCSGRVRSVSLFRCLSWSDVLFIVPCDSPAVVILSNVFIISCSFLCPNPVSGGRRLAWFRIHAWGVCDPGFKSQRPHHKHQRHDDEVI